MTDTNIPLIAHDWQDDCLEVLGQQPLLKLYTQICLCFAVADDFSHSGIISTLTNGLDRLTASFPWIAGQVVNEGACEGNSGIFRIKPLEKIPRLVVKDLRHDPSMPTMNTLRRAGFPFRMLDESVVAPRRTLPGSPDEAALDSSPVLLLQATFIVGGLLLTFLGQHNTMDGLGQGQIIHLLSKACCNEPFTREELSSGNLPRRNIIPLLDEAYEPGLELAHQMRLTPPQPISDNPTLLPPSRSTWAYFTFKSASLATLKSLATATVPSGYISTDDALSAFIWQSVARARLPRLNPTAQSTFARAVSVRRHFGIPETYPGVAQNMTYLTYTIQKLVDAPLGVVASQLRSAMDPKTSDLAHQTRALATLLSRTPDKAAVSVTSTIDPAVDVTLSSWAKLDCYSLDFSLGLGTPEAVRRPQFTPVEGLLYLMPKALDGEISLAICLRDEDMERLRVDEGFAKYGTYIK